VKICVQLKEKKKKKERTSGGLEEGIKVDACGAIQGTAEM